MEIRIYLLQHVLRNESGQPSLVPRKVLAVDEGTLGNCGPAFACAQLEERAQGDQPKSDGGRCHAQSPEVRLVRDDEGPIYNFRCDTRWHLRQVGREPLER